MKILIVHNFYQHPGGEDTVVANEMALLKAGGHEVSLYSVHNDDISSPWRKAKAALSTIYNPVAKRALTRHLNELRPEIMHVHNFFPQLSPAVFGAARAAGVPSVLTLHNFRILCPTGVLYHAGRPTERSLHESPWWTVRERVYRNSLGATIALASMISLHKRLGTWRRSVDRFIALTHFAKRKFVEAGLPADLIEVKGNATEAPTRQAVAAAGSRVGALYVGRLSEEKGPQILADAWEGIEYPLRIAGEGPLIESIRALGNPNIFLLGQLNKESIRAEMLRAAFLVLPSVCYEMFPVTLAEAFGCGLPVIGSRIGGLHDLICYGMTGLHVEAGNLQDLRDKTQWAMSHPKEMLKMGESARAQYESAYTPSANYIDLLKVYENAIGQNLGRGSGG